MSVVAKFALNIHACEFVYKLCSQAKQLGTGSAVVSGKVLGLRLGIALPVDDRAKRYHSTALGLFPSKSDRWPSTL